MSWLFPLGVSLGLLGCSTEPRSMAECTDADCRQRFVYAAWAEGAPQAAALISEISLNEERIALVSELVTADPGNASALCTALPAGEARHSCNSVTSRPHLWARSPPPQKVQDKPRTAPGPASTMVMLGPQLKSKYAGIAGDVSSCQGQGEIRSCLQARAAELAALHQPEAAARVCAAVSDQRWRWECMFRAGEESIRGTGGEGYDVALELCLGAGEFKPRCIQKIGVALMSLAPDSTMTAEHWAPVKTAATHMEAAWQERFPERGVEVVMAFWAGSLAFAYSQTEVVTGDPLDSLQDPALVPHIRAAAAFRLLQQGSARSHDLAGWVAALETALEVRAPRSTPGAARRDLTGLRDHWPRDEASDGEIPAMTLHGFSRRTYSDDPQVDLALCVLEAGGQLPTLPTSLLDEGDAHADPLVRWTAERLRRRARRGASGPPKGTLSPTPPPSASAPPPPHPPSGPTSTSPGP